MAKYRLELSSAHDDQSLAQVRFVVHGSSLADSEKILRDGLITVEGKAVISTNLKAAYEDAASDASPEGGVITVLATPTNSFIGYAAFTNAYIDRALKVVMGAPLRYASARRQLAFYLSPDVEASRKRIEGEVMGGVPLSSHPTFSIDPSHVIGRFALSSGVLNAVTQLEVSANAFEPIDFNRVEATLQGLFSVKEAAQSVLMPTMLRDIAVGTVEAMILSRMRVLRWQGLALLGFRFREGRQDVAVATPNDLAAHKKRVADYHNLLKSSNMFVAELAWLKIYVSHQLELMSVEIEGAELEAA